MRSRGLFITFEGGEGAGKTTLINEVARQLMSEGSSVLKTREPGGTPLGESIRNLLLQQGHISSYAELSLFLASRAQHIKEVIGPALEQGKIVLCDRFNDSSVAYQGAARGLGMEKVSQFCDFISQGLKPNLTLYLDIEPELGLTRLKKTRTQDRIEEETKPFHERIRQAYIQIHYQDPKRFHLIDASQSPAKVFEEAMRLIQASVRKI